MRYTKDDVLKLKELVNEINSLIIDKFPCSNVKIFFSQKMGKTIELEVFEKI